MTVGISRKRNRSFRRLTGGRGTPLHYLTARNGCHAILQNFTARNGCHAITLLLPFFSTSYALRVRHSRKATSRYGQVFNSVLYQTLVISLTPILDRGESPHRRLFCTLFSSPEKSRILLSHFQKRAVAAANFISALSCRCRNSNPPCRRPRTPSRWAGARGKRGSRWL